MTEDRENLIHNKEAFKKIYQFINALTVAKIATA